MSSSWNVSLALIRLSSHLTVVLVTQEIDTSGTIRGNQHPLIIYHQAFIINRLNFFNIYSIKDHNIRVSLESHQSSLISLELFIILFLPFPIIINNSVNHTPVGSVSREGQSQYSCSTTYLQDDHGVQPGWSSKAYYR
jgi:hypothetical protein